MKKALRAAAVVMVLCILLTIPSAAQSSSATDSVVRAALASESLTGDKDQGVSLIKQDKLNEAGQYFNEELKKNENDRAAFFGRGVVHWKQNDAANACRDWSAVLALGDTAAFKLLDKNCHGNMVIDEDTIPAKKYHQMFAKKSGSQQEPPAPVNFAEVMPQFPGGDRALFDYMKKNTRYPDEARRKSIQGRVYVSFVVSSKGKIRFPHVERGIGGGCDEAALNLVRSMPAWQPGKQDGKAVPVRYSLPVNFRKN